MSEVSSASVLRQFVHGIANMIQPFRSAQVEGFASYAILRDHGVDYTPQKRPKDIPRHQPKRCFQNSLEFVLSNPEYTYVEGYAIHLIPIHHAWVVSPGGRIVDLTWETPGEAYYGVPLDIDAVRTAAMRSKIYSFFFNHKWERELALLNPDSYLKEPS